MKYLKAALALALIATFTASGAAADAVLDQPGQTVSWSSPGSYTVDVSDVEKLNATLEGAGGGDGEGGNGGIGGLTVGQVDLSGQNTIYVYVGGEGQDNIEDCSPTGGGFNGGGDAQSGNCGGGDYNAGGGGGATDIRTSQSLGTSSNPNRILVAGGGGGVGYDNGGSFMDGGGSTVSDNGRDDCSDTGEFFYGSVTPDGDCSSYGYSTGGGGAGWYGGDDGNSGGEGGSGYKGHSLVISGSLTNGGADGGDGYAELEVIKTTNKQPQFNETNIDPDPPLIGQNVSYNSTTYDPDGSISETCLKLEYAGSQVYQDCKASNTPEWNNVFEPSTGNKWLNATFNTTDNKGSTVTTELDRYLSDTGGSVNIKRPSGEITSYQLLYDVDFTDSDSKPGESITCNFKVNGNSVANHTGTESFGFSGTLQLEDYQAKSNNLDAVCEDPSGNTASDTGSFYAWRGLNASAFDLDTGNAMQNWSIYMDNGSSTFSDHNLSNSERWEFDNLPNGDVNITFSDGSDTKYYFNKTLERVINSTRYYREEVDLEPKDENPLSLKADPGWLLDEGEEFTITASAPEGQSEGTLTVDGREVDRVYTATLDFGIYPVNWSVPETENYRPTHKSNTLQILSSGFGATSNTTMAFKKRIEPTSNPYLVNFSSFISNDQVRSNLGDVYTPHENVSLSRTGQDNQLLEIDHSNYAGSKINLTWGNYFANRSYSTTTKPSADTLDLGNTSYQEINPYYVLTYNLEQTGENKLPPNANVTTSLLSESGVTSYRVEDARYLVAAREQVDEIETTVQYSATDIYQRNILPTSKVEYRNIYLVDANKNQVVELLLEKRDQTGDYSDAFVRIKKSLSGSKRAITEQYFDAEEKTVVYLINGEKYTIEVVSEDREQTRSIGNLYVDTVDLTKTIRIQELSSLDPESGNMTYNLYQEGTQVKLDFSSPSDQSNNVTLKVWNYTDGESQNLLYENTVSDVQQANLNYDVNSSLNTTNVSVRAKGIIESEKFGNLDFAQLFNFDGDIPLAGIDLPGDTLKAAVVFLITVTPMFFNPKLARLAAAVQVLEAAFFALVLGWISIGTAVMSSGGTIAFAGILVLIESWNESPTSQARVAR